MDEFEMILSKSLNDLCEFFIFLIGGMLRLGGEEFIESFLHLFSHGGSLRNLSNLK